MDTINEFDFFKDINYKENDNLANTLHAFSPKNNKEKNPTVVFIHGGAWKSGSKDSFLGIMLNFAAKGYTVATTGYRLSDEAPFPAAIEDVACSLRFLKTNANKYRIDPDRIALFGSSAGGHLALLAAATQETDMFNVGPYQEANSIVKAVINICGPTDLTTIVDQIVESEANEGGVAVLHQFLGENQASKASPMTHITPAMPPVLIIHGGSDEIVPIIQAYSLEEALKTNGVTVRTIYHPKASHGVLRFNFEQNIETCLAFLSEHL